MLLQKALCHHWVMPSMAVLLCVLFCFLKKSIQNICLPLLQPLSSASPGSPLSLETMARHSPKPRCSPFSAPPCLTGKFSADDVKTTAFWIVFCTLSGEGLGGFFCEICVFHNVFIFACCGWAKTGAEHPNCSVLSRLGWQFPSLSRVIPAHGAAERAVTPKASPSAHHPLGAHPFPKLQEQLWIFLREQRSRCCSLFLLFSKICFFNPC